MPACAWLPDLGPTRVRAWACNCRACQIHRPIGTPTRTTCHVARRPDQRGTCRANQIRAPLATPTRSTCQVATGSQSQWSQITYQLHCMACVCLISGNGCCPYAFGVRHHLARLRMAEFRTRLKELRWESNFIGQYTAEKIENPILLKHCTIPKKKTTTKKSDALILEP